jgi:hypothetical protein
VRSLLIPLALITAALVGTRLYADDASPKQPTKPGLPSTDHVEMGLPFAIEPVPTTDNGACACQSTCQTTCCRHHHGVAPRGNLLASLRSRLHPCPTCRGCRCGYGCLISTPIYAYFTDQCGDCGTSHGTATPSCGCGR